MHVAKDTVDMLRPLPLFFFTWIVRALAMQPRKMSSIPMLCGSKLRLLNSSLFDCKLAAVKMVKSLGGRVWMERMFANLTGGTRGKTLLRTEMTALWTLAGPVCRKSFRIAYC